MVVFPHAKINLGLNILRLRSDGYHDIDSIMVPVGWSDVLEVVPAIKEPRTTLECHGSEDLDCSEDDNLVIRAYNAVKSVCRDIPSVRIFCRKTFRPEPVWVAAQLMQHTLCVHSTRCFRWVSAMEPWQKLYLLSAPTVLFRLQQRHSSFRHRNNVAQGLNSDTERPHNSHLSP